MDNIGVIEETLICCLPLRPITPLPAPFR
jgi:hypothetical protein